MRYKGIQLENYRNYEKRSFDFHPKVNLFVGQNAAGKTNLLESLYVTSYGKSFRTNKDKDLIRFGEDFCRISGIFTREITGDEEHSIEIVFTADGNRKGNVDGLDFEKYSDIFDHVLAVVFSPEDLKIIKESPEKRREFVDLELGRLSLAYYRDMMIYRRALQQRNAYLKEDQRDLRALTIWDENLIKYGARILLARKDFVEKLNRICQKIHGELTGGKESILLDYEANVEFAVDNLVEKRDKLAAIEDALRDAFENSRENDFRLRYTTKGPQKDDVAVYLNGINARTFGSQGQQRTAALSMKLSEVELVKEEKGEYPILLLDDVLSELDSDRQSFLINALDDVQLFITTTDLTEQVKQQLPDSKVITI